MAYASVASLLETIDHVNYHGDSSISSRFKDQITSLHQHATFLQSFLENGDPNRATNWEETIRDVADRAEEIIDILVSDSLLKSSKSEVDDGFNELERVTEEMKSTVDRVKGRGIKAKAEPDAELLEIISLLREGSLDLETIAILGEGGMGKSTLARNAYNHPFVKEHFDVRVWSTIGHKITVGHEYSGRDIIVDLLRCINIESDSDSDDEPTESMYASLMGRRYLIVLHDIWTLQSLVEARLALPDNGNGSRIILTTDYYSFSDFADHVHEMRLLDEDTTWNLLREKVFKGDPCPSQLEHYGRIVAKGCRGHQLTIEMISGILGADQTKAAWEDVSENIKSISDGDYVHYRVQSLSYRYLPHHLRIYFLYFGCFPGDHEIRVSKLIKLWAAEGFLTQSETKSFHETGEECLEDLVRRSLVSVSKRKCNGRIKSVKVHSHVRYLCQTQLHTGNFIYDDGRYGKFEQQFAAVQLQSCRLLSISNYGQDFLEGIYDSTIRTLILYLSNHGGVGVRQSIGNVRLLRILDLLNAYDYDLPKQVFQLFHLRYLAFHSGFSISKAISHLQNLQTLVVCPWETDRKLFFKLPESIWRMPQLRHLLNFSFNLPIPTLELEGEGEEFALENLETLSRVVDFVCSRENLKMIPNVKKMNIYYTESFKDVVGDIELHNLISLHKLEILKVEMEWSSSVEKHNKMSLAFPPMLKKLNLCGLQLPWEDMKIVASLPNLEVLKLRKHTCVGKTWETSEGGFTCLTYLMIEGSDLENWITKSNHFPKLKNLVLRSCLHLSDVPREIGEIPILELMELDGMNRSLVKSAKRIQEDHDLLQVHVLE